MAAGSTAALVHLGAGLAAAGRPRAAALAYEAAALGDGEPLARAAARNDAAKGLLHSLTAAPSAAPAGGSASGAPAAAAGVMPTLSRARHNTEQACLLLRDVAGGLGLTLEALALTEEVYTRTGDARGVLRILARAHRVLRDADPPSTLAAATAGGGGGGGDRDVDRWAWWLYLRGRAVTVQARSAPAAAMTVAAESAAECKRRGDDRAACGFLLGLCQLRLAQTASAVDLVAVAADLAAVGAILDGARGGAPAVVPPAGAPVTADEGDGSPPTKRLRPAAAVDDAEAVVMRVAMLALRAVVDLRRGAFPAVVAAAAAHSAAFNACMAAVKPKRVAAGGAVPPRSRWAWLSLRPLRALLTHFSATALSGSDPRGAAVRSVAALKAVGMPAPPPADEPTALKSALAAKSLGVFDEDCQLALAVALLEGAARCELTRCGFSAAAPFVRAAGALAACLSDGSAKAACGAAATLLHGQYLALLGNSQAASDALERLEEVAQGSAAAGVLLDTQRMAAAHGSALTGRPVASFLHADGGAAAAAAAGSAGENVQVEAAVAFAQSLLCAQKDDVRGAAGLLHTALQQTGCADGVRGMATNRGGVVNRALAATILSVRVGLLSVSGAAAAAPALGTTSVVLTAADEAAGVEVAEQWAKDVSDVTTRIRIVKNTKRTSQRELDVDGARTAKALVGALQSDLSKRQLQAPQW